MKPRKNSRIRRPRREDRSLSREVATHAPDVYDAQAKLATEIAFHVGFADAADAARKKGDPTAAALATKRENARQRRDTARANLVALLGGDRASVTAFEAAVMRDRRSLVVLAMADARVRARLAQAIVDAAWFLRTHGITDATACGAVHVAHHRIGLGRGFLDEASRTLDASLAKVGSDLVSMGERALARALEIHAATREPERTAIELLLAARDAAPPPTVGRCDETSTTEASGEPVRASVTRPTAATAETSGTSPKTRQRGEEPTGEGIASGSSGSIAGASGGGGVPGSSTRTVYAGEVHEHLSHPAVRNPPLETVRADPNAPIVRNGRWVFPGEPEDDENDRPRVRIEDRAARPEFAHVEGPRPPEEGDAYRIAGSYSKTKNAPTKPIAPPTYDTRSGRWVSPGDAPVRDATRGAPPEVAARIAEHERQIAASREGVKS